MVSALFRDGDVVVVVVSGNSNGAASSAAPSTPAATSRGTMVVRVVPDDNSCLFRSVNALLMRPDTEASIYDLRAEVSAVVTASPKLFSEAFLGRPTAEYCSWIMSENSWGGAIDLSILCTRYAVELAAFDVKTLRLDRYGEGNGYEKVGYLLYDGIHYNYMAMPSRNSSDITLFDLTDAAMLSSAKSLAQKEHDGNKFTDTANFALRCGQCNTLLKGEKQAVEHASKTGHTDFQEK